ncbi:MAG: hypothetical protein ACTHK0_05470 [Ginsengibacter sp.]
MSSVFENIKKLPVSEKAELFYLLPEDKELENYLISNDQLYKELARRDKAYAEKKTHLTTRQELSERLKHLRNAV